MDTEGFLNHETPFRYHFSTDDVSHEEVAPPKQFLPTLLEEGSGDVDSRIFIDVTHGTSTNHNETTDFLNGRDVDEDRHSSSFGSSTESTDYEVRQDANTQTTIT